MKKESLGDAKHHEHLNLTKPKTGYNTLFVTTPKRQNYDVWIRNIMREMKKDVRKANKQKRALSEQQAELHQQVQEVQSSLLVVAEGDDTGRAALHHKLGLLAQEQKQLKRKNDQLTEKIRQLEAQQNNTTRPNE